MCEIWNDVETVTEIIATSLSKKEILVRLNLTSNGVRYYNQLKKFIEMYGINVDHLSRQRLKRDYWNNLDQAVRESFSISEVVDRLGLKQYGSNHQRVNKEIVNRGLDISHFSAQKRRRKQGEVKHRSSMRRKVLRENLVPYECSCCGNDGNWLNNPLTLQLDHIDGDSSNHNLENLRFLCPNCHTQTATWGGNKTNS